jgi:hypothetical protein
MYTSAIRRAIVNSLPPGIQLRKLEMQESLILLIGLDRRSGLHQIYLNDFLASFKPKCVLTQVQPDNPYFIKSDSDFMTEWTSFLKSSKASFHVNPWPEYLSDVIMDQTKLMELSGSLFYNSRKYFFTSLKGVYTLLNPSCMPGVPEYKDLPENFVSALFWVYNNPDLSDCAILTEMPELIYRDQIVRKMSLKDMRDLFEQYNISKDDTENRLDPRFLHPEIFLRPKIKYMTEVMKQSCISYKRSIAVVDNDLVESIEQEWSDLNPNLQKLKDLLKIPSDSEQSVFIEYIEKHVILELISENFLQRYYVDHGVFPYTGVGTEGYNEGIYDQVLDTWNYYKEQYLDKLKTLHGKSSGRKVKRKSKK